MSKKCNVRLLKKYAHECSSYKEIGKRMGVSTSTANKWCHEVGIVPNKRAEFKGTGINADRHLCKTCMFRNESCNSISCDYICYTNQQRGCKPEECNVYQKGMPADARRIYRGQ